MRLRKHIHPKSFIDALVTFFMLLVIPVIYHFELWIVLPTFYPPGSLAYLFHFLLGTFILFNSCANLVAVILIDTSIKGVILPSEVDQNWRFCLECESFAPPRSWHCSTCKICILKRDHHCKFTSCCIGHYNHRYFMMFVFYIFIATIYSAYFNIRFCFQYFTFSSWLSTFKILFPFASLLIDRTEAQLYNGLIIIVVVGGLFTGALLHYHMDCILKGMTTPESKRNVNIYNQGRMDNLKMVFGNRWYLVWISPFIKSELPFDGIKWKTQNSPKDK